MIFAPTIIQNTLPQVSVTAADSGSPSITYKQIKQSLGSQVYNIDRFYLYSTIKNQLIGVIKYNRYDINGNIDVRNIVTTLDPYQLESALYKDLTKSDFGFILNGNSSVSSTILPQAYIILRLFTRRITTNLGANMNFSEMENVFKRHYYSTFNGFELGGEASISIDDLKPRIEEIITTKNLQIQQQNNDGVILLSAAAIGVGLYLIYGKQQ
jgi:hypothetical protein